MYNVIEFAQSNSLVTLASCDLESYRVQCHVKALWTKTHQLMGKEHNIYEKKNTQDNKNAIERKTLQSCVQEQKTSFELKSGSTKK